MPLQILKAFGFDDASITYVPFGSGLINQTWLIKTKDSEFILQRVNDHVFKQPGDIACNIKMIANFLKQFSPTYLFVPSVKTVDGHELYHEVGKGYYRMMPFVAGSHTIDAVENVKQAYEASRQFALFTYNLKDFDSQKLKVTLADFHDLSIRYQQFLDALNNGNKQRISESAKEINFLKKHKNVVDEYENIKINPAFKQRVTHHDTKISNALFDEHDNGLCVIDLDTVMPGLFISDVGDMLRTYLSPVSEDETDFTKIEVRVDYFKAIADGYLSIMQHELTQAELSRFVFAGKFLIYMHVLRFLTDYLNNDTYYGAKYEKHNLMRSRNQMELYEKLLEKEDQLNSIIQEYQVAGGVVRGSCELQLFKKALQWMPGI